MAAPASASGNAEVWAAGILPKGDIQADEFLSAAATRAFDGRGVVVAIFDTGCDPGAPGLQRTTDGRPKFLDFVDTTGSGDVDCKTTATAKADGTVSGVTGRVLRLNAQWKNPSKKYYLGVKTAYELFPAPLVDRIKSERKAKWDVAQRSLEAELQTAISDFDARCKAEDKEKADKEKDSKDSAKEDPSAAAQAKADRERERKRAKSDLETRLSEARAMQRNFEDSGPLYDVVVWCETEQTAATSSAGSDAKATPAAAPTAPRVWRAAIDCKQNGDLSSAVGMTNYRLEHQWSTFSAEDRMNYSLNVYPPSSDGGSPVCSIVVQAGAHGTHVAGIVGAHFEKSPELNGIAPGCQMISVKIGDSRLGSMETGTGLNRALIAALENRVDVINMSYGEPAGRPNVGRFCDLATELVSKHGIVYVCSAGNSGPALTTAGAPGATTSAMIGVGAYVSPAMKAVEYSLRQTTPETMYTWSSRGPTSDGSLGVCITASGGAVAPVPNWCLQQNQRMNGTSMAAPSAAGGVALLLSASKAQKLPTSPFRIRRALENTARFVEGVEPWAQNTGLMQVVKAHNYLVKYASYSDADIDFRVCIPRRNNARGVYLREPNETESAQDMDVRIDTVFKPLLSTSTAPVDNQPKVDFFLKINLVSTAPDWIRVAPQFVLMNNGHTFGIQIDPTALPEGSGAHFGQILGFDAACPERGPVFRVPITVIRPITLSPQCATTGSGVCSKKKAGKSASKAATATAASTAAEGSVTAAPKIAVVHHTHAPSDSKQLGKASPAPAVDSASKTLDKAVRSSTDSGSGSTAGGDAKVAKPSSAPGMAGAWSYYYSGQAFTAGAIVRKFVVVPAGATWADITVTGRGIDTYRNVVLHTLYLLPQLTFRETECEHMFQMAATTNQFEERVSINVRAGTTLELCLAQYWSALGDSTMDLEVVFHGIALEPPQTEFVHGAGAMRVDLYSRLRSEAANVRAKFDRLRSTLKPKPGATVAPLFTAGGSGDALGRDLFWERRGVHAVTLTYEFELKEAMKVTPRVPLLNGQLYESAMESQLWMLFDKHKRHIATGDAWPSAVKLQKGKYTLRLQLRAESPALLDALKDSLCAVIDCDLPKAVSLQVFPSRNAVVLGAGGAASSKFKMERGSRKTVFLGAAKAAALPAFAKSGDVLLGQLCVSTPHHKDLKHRKDFGNFDLTYVLPAAAPKKKADKSADSAAAAPKKSGDKKNGFDAEAQLRDLQIDFLKSLLKGSDSDAVKQRNDAFAAFAPALLSKYPKHLPLLALRIAQLTAQQKDKDTAVTASDVVNACDALVAAVDAKEIWLHFGRVLPEDATIADTDARKEMTERKDRVVDAITSKLLCAMNVIVKLDKQAAEKADKPEKPAAADKKDAAPVVAPAEERAKWVGVFDRAFTDLRTWYDFKANAKAVRSKPVVGALWVEMLLRREFGSLLKTLNEWLGEADDETDASLRETAEAMRKECLTAAQLGRAWQHWADYDTVWQSIKKPKDFRLH